MANTVNESAIKKLKVLFTVVDRNKGEFYMDVISQFEVNCQMQLQGLGTATSELVALLVSRLTMIGPSVSRGLSFRSVSFFFAAITGDFPESSCSCLVAYFL